MAPSSPTASRASTHWRTLPQRTERGPAAFVATRPPEVAKAPDAGGDDAVDPRPFGVGGADALVGPKAREGGAGEGRRHAAGSYHAPRTTHYVPVSLTRWRPRVMLVPSHDDRRTARATHSHRDRPPARPRMGRMGRRAAPQPRRLLRAPRPVLPLCRAHAGGAVRCGGGRALPARAQARSAGAGAAPRRRLGPGGGVRPRGPVAHRARGFLLWRRGPAS